MERLLFRLPGGEGVARAAATLLTSTSLMSQKTKLRSSPKLFLAFGRCFPS
jgi:hypothetical protein